MLDWPVGVPPHVWNWVFGWGLMFSGFVSGAIVGMGFHRPDFLGGYGSFRRRLVRIGHIAQEALGMVNILYGLSAWPAAGSVAEAIATPAFIVGGVAMPTVCFLAAWRPGFRHLFAVPVVALGAAVLATALFPFL